MNLKTILNNKYCSYGMLIGISILFLIRAFSFSYHDFATYFYGGYFLRIGEFTTEIYELVPFNLKIKSITSAQIFGNFTPNTPFLSIIFVPFSFFEIQTAKILFNSLSIIAFLFSLKRLLEYYKISNRYIFLIPILFLVPLKNNLLFGQVYLISFFLLSEGFLAFKKGKIPLMAILWGIVIFLKVFPLVLFAFLFLKKEYKASIYLFISCSVLLIFSISINGLEVWKYFILEVMPKASNGEISGPYIPGYQSMLMLLKELFVYDSVENKTALIHSYPIYNAVLTAFKLFILSTGIIISIKSKSDLKTFSYWIIASIILTPTGSTYSGVLFIFLFIHIITSVNYKTAKIVALILILLICNLPVNKFFNLPTLLTYPRLILNLMLYVLLFLSFIKGKKQWSLILIPTVAIATFIGLLAKSAPPDSWYISNQPHRRLFDYTFKQNTLTYSYWNLNGKNVYNTKMKFNKIDSTSVKIIENQLYYKKKKITNSKDNKLKPTLVNDSIIIYLTDRRRGIGFYCFNSINIITQK